MPGQGTATVLLPGAMAAFVLNRTYHLQFAALPVGSEILVQDRTSGPCLQRVLVDDVVSAAATAEFSG